MNVPLTIPQTIALYHLKYPDGLICNECGILLATDPETYSKSKLTEAKRLTYVCSECRLEAAEEARTRQVRAETGRRNLALARAGKRERRDTRVSSETTESPLLNALTDANLQYSKVSTAAPLSARRKRGGRAALTPEAKKQGRRESQRRWRAKQQTSGLSLVPA